MKKLAKLAIATCTRMVQCEAIGMWCVCNWGCPGYGEP